MSSDSRLPFITLFKHPVQLFALGFGSGLSPFAPGTVATALAALIYYFFLADLGFFYFSLVIIASSLVGIYICGKSAELLDTHDHPAIVWDEFVGFWIAMTLAVEGWQWLLVAFLLFRFFDIIKPWPISAIDRWVKGGVGIMLDDQLAGIFTFLIIQLILVPIFT